MNPVTSEVCDLLKLMPDAQVDEILEFISELRAARLGVPNGFTIAVSWMEFDTARTHGRPAARRALVDEKVSQLRQTLVAELDRRRLLPS